MPRLGRTARVARRRAPFTTPWTSADVALITVTPNIQNDLHSGTIAEANAWVDIWVPQIIASAAYRSGRLAVIIAWDKVSVPATRRLLPP